MKLKQLHEAKLAGVRLPNKDEIENAIAEYLVFGAVESLKEIRKTDPDVEANMEAAKDLAEDSAGFQIHEMFPGVLDKIRRL